MGVVYTLCVDGIYYSILSVQMKNRIIGNMRAVKGKYKMDVYVKVDVCMCVNFFCGKNKKIRKKLKKIRLYII